MDYARANGFKVIPACPYVKRFVEMHPEYADVTE
jgi:predicted GNAT family acetyltransferase